MTSSSNGRYNGFSYCREAFCNILKWCGDCLCCRSCFSDNGKDTEAQKKKNNTSVKNSGSRSAKVPNNQGSEGRQGNNLSKPLYVSNQPRKPEDKVKIQNKQYLSRGQGFPNMPHSKLNTKDDTSKETDNNFDGQYTHYSVNSLVTKDNGKTNFDELEKFKVSQSLIEVNLMKSRYNDYRYNKAAHSIINKNVAVNNKGFGSGTLIDSDNESTPEIMKGKKQGVHSTGLGIYKNSNKGIKSDDAYTYLEEYETINEIGKPEKYEKLGARRIAPVRHNQRQKPRNMDMGDDSENEPCLRKKAKHQSKYISMPPKIGNIDAHEGIKNPGKTSITDSCDILFEDRCPYNHTVDIRAHEIKPLLTEKINYQGEDVSGEFKDVRYGKPRSIPQKHRHTNYRDSIKGVAKVGDSKLTTSFDINNLYESETCEDNFDDDTANTKSLICIEGFKIDDYDIPNATRTPRPVKWPGYYKTAPRREKLMSKSIFPLETKIKGSEKHCLTVNSPPMCEQLMSKVNIPLETKMQESTNHNLASDIMSSVTHRNSEYLSEDNSTKCTDVARYHRELNTNDLSCPDPCYGEIKACSSEEYFDAMEISPRIVSPIYNEGNIEDNDNKALIEENVTDDGDQKTDHDMDKNVEATDIEERKETKLDEPGILNGTDEHTKDNKGTYIPNSANQADEESIASSSDITIEIDEDFEKEANMTGSEGSMDIDDGFGDYGYKSVKPVPLENPRGFCFFNCVMQVLRSCREFDRKIIEYHDFDLIADSKADDGDKIFVNYFCKLMVEISKNESTSIYYQSLKPVHKFFQESMDGDDVQKCFMVVLTTINNVIKKQESKRLKYKRPANKADGEFRKFRNKNRGFIFKLFYGQMRYSTECKICEFVHHETFQVFKTLPLPVPNSKSTNLSTCINNFLRPSSIDMEEKLDCKCAGGSLDFESKTLITFAPKYLFIYLTRGSYYTNGVKNNTNVEFGKSLNLPTSKGLQKYRLVSVIDHVGDNDGGHYYCKCNYEGKYWWLISDTQVTKLGTDFKDVISKHAIALMFKKL